MILPDDEIQERIESPLNLMNRLRSAIKSTGKSSNTQHPSMPPKAEDIVADLEDKLKNTSTRSKANGIMIAAMDELSRRLPEVRTPEKLAQIATEMSRVVSNHDNKPAGSLIQSQIIVYAPQVQRLESFDIIDITE